MLSRGDFIVENPIRLSEILGYPEKFRYFFRFLKFALKTEIRIIPVYGI